MTNNELLLAMSDMMDRKLRAELQPLKNEMQNMKGEMQNMKGEMQNMRGEIHQIKLFQENIILPRLETIESCYTDTYRRYQDNADRMEAVYADVDIMKKVITEHSQQLQKLA
ncbi:MAG: hypothetical protein NC314_12240 [Roseburia sp.]|nr:hypothetical protein [Ruminococcus sp.]MCM1156145.1 hypothetical protein [Roseburia sp.]MCM1243603.1 hypothetical protein [Roseburia sp.]